VKHESHFGNQHNPWAIRLLLNWLTQGLNVMPKVKFHPIKSVKKVVDELTKHYVSNIKELEFDLERNFIVPIINKPGEIVKLAKWELDIRQGFIFHIQNNFQPKYNSGVIFVEKEKKIPHSN